MATSLFILYSEIANKASRHERALRQRLFLRLRHQPGSSGLPVLGDPRRLIAPPLDGLTPLVAMKLAIYQAMRDQDVSQRDLTKRLAVDVRQARRLLDLDHLSRLGQLETALFNLGKSSPSISKIRLLSDLFAVSYSDD